MSDRARRRAASHTVTWRQEKPASTYLISLAAAPFAKISDRWRGIPVDYYVYREDSALARPLFGVTPDMMETYSRLTGVPYPWNKYAQATVADFIGGMENVSATTLVDWLPDARAYRDRPWYRQSLIPHELAHQWFGDLVTAENWANYWLNEGMAEFMPGQYWGAKQRRATRSRTTTWPSTSSSSGSTRGGGCRSPPTTPTTSIPRARWCSRC